MKGVVHSTNLFVNLSLYHSVDREFVVLCILFCRGTNIVQMYLRAIELLFHQQW